MAVAVGPLEMSVEPPCGGNQIAKGVRHGACEGSVEEKIPSSRKSKWSTAMRSGTFCPRKNSVRSSHWRVAFPDDPTPKSPNEQAPIAVHQIPGRLFSFTSSRMVSFHIMCKAL